MVHRRPAGRDPWPQELGDAATPPDSKAPSSRCSGAQDAGAGERHGRAALLVPAGRPPGQPVEHHGSAGQSLPAGVDGAQRIGDEEAASRFESMELEAEDGGGRRLRRPIHLLREGPGLEWIMRAVPELQAGGRRKGGGEEDGDGGVGWGSREWGPTRRSG
jgi:hypothetical protein